MAKSILILRILSFILCVFGVSHFVQAQNSISGNIVDTDTNEPLIGVSIIIKGTVAGTITDASGNFTLNSKTTPPFTLVISSIGYQTQEVLFDGSINSLSISLSEQTITGQEVVVSASKVEESILESPVTIEKMDLLAIRNSPSSNFYEALQNIKGVDMNTQSVNFQAPNTRGFGGNANFRMLQLIDGVDNQGPGLAFSPGNLIGISEIDVESVELLPGASSVLYGPGAINGTLLINSKNPFQYQGFSGYAKVGVMHINSNAAPTSPMYDVGFRYAKAFNDRFAFKVNIGFVQALDWHAADYRNRATVNGAQFGTDETNQRNNPGYYGVNTYGGAVAAPLPLGPGGTPVTVARTGYREADLVDYTTNSLKFNLATHYRISDNVEAIMQVAGGYGNSVYTGAARVRLGNFFYWQGKAELKGSNFFLRAYTTQERSGESYDIGFVGLGLNRAGKSDQQWFEDYSLAFRGAAIGLGVAAFDHNFAREFADGNLSNNFSANQLNFFGITSGLRNNLGRLTPGSPDFNRVKNDLVNTPISQGGALFFDESNLYHTEGMYNFNKIINPNTVELIVGGHYRMIQLNSRGTVFDDAERRLNISEVGGYIQATKKVFNDKLKLTASARYDKNQNFEGRFTPRVAAVYSLGNARQHNIRISYQTAFRNPTVQDQYLNLTVGGFVRVVGGLPEFIERNNLNNNVVRADAQSIGNYLQLLNTQGAVAARTNGTYRFNQFRPEFVNSFELGYKSLINNKLFIDTYVYYNQYSNFIGTLNFIAPNTGQDITTVQFNPADASPVIGTFQLFQVPVNLANLNSYGWGVGVDYNLPAGFTIGGNISHNKLLDAPSNFRTQFNTPEYRTNVSFGNRNIKGTSIGFNVVWRWQETFTWQSTFGDGVIPAYHTLDAQISYRLKDLKSIAKIGGTNLLNQFYTQSFGNPQIGALYYVSITFDQIFNK